MNEPEPDRDETFWHELAILGRGVPISAPTASTAADTADTDELILRFTTGDATPEEEMRLRRLTLQQPDLARRMANAFQRLLDVETGPSASAREVWARLTASPPGYSAPTRLVDLAIRLLSEGLELLHSAGRPAYPILATRSVAPEPTYSIAQEFLTSAGVLDVIVDFCDASSWRLTARPKLLATSARPREFTISLSDAGGVVHSESPLTERGLVIGALPAGEYDLIVAEAGEERSRLSISCRIPGNSD